MNPATVFQTVVAVVFGGMFLILIWIIYIAFWDRNQSRKRLDNWHPPEDHDA